MKQALLLLTVAITLLCSCSSNEHTIKLFNGSIVSARDNFDRSFTNGDTVCVVTTGASVIAEWSIDNTGNMRDTAMLVSYTFADSTTKTWIREYHRGVVLR